MRALILADTHIPHRAKALPNRVIDEIKSIDIIIHAGDFTSYAFFDELKSLKNIYAVRGNMDDDKLYEVLPETAIFSIEGVKIALYHGIGAAWGIDQKVFEKFSKYEELNLIIFGHSHKPFKSEVNGVTLFNPGSPTDTIFAPQRSYGILEIVNGKIIKIEHVLL
ncbi:MAG TPA: metallophosphoesterase family protein [Candidatus Hydrothermia bacterium]|nr:metallophosphoesterase family protein [Candidatus Hydrothermae bacterium]MDD3648536.1 metallophosphoesterase family protein [Candidatus Hydrothermia bacterium]MDD5572723.1 metallophosphoesterase family protein [Candidatus Hydrothermia bacterium]HOK22604.1 metallophosphoesterase family protein [Candidatus Hydrothermia bacterium]HOL23311.1 metallophosphoesterase family protein [Candidatus Hydrothermia bacterium]